MDPVQASPTSPSARAHVVPLAVVLAGCGAHLASVARLGWIPHDEGQLLECAQRVLAGQVPHRDFDEAYTGALTLLHAAAVALLGGDLLALRVPFLVAAWLVLPVIYALAARAVPPAAAALVTLAAYAWGPPCYVASLPTWWVLFLTLGGALALARGHDAGPGRARWLALAGLCAGLATTVKVVGLYALAGFVLALVHDEQADDAARPDAGARRRGWSALVVLGAGAFVLVVVATLRRRLGAPEALHLVLPAVAAGGALAAFEWRRAGRGLAAERARGLAARLGPLLAGFAAPVLVLAVGFLVEGALPALLRGTLVTPMQRVATAGMDLPRVGAWSLAAALPLLMLVALPRLAASRGRLAVGVAVAAGLLVLLDAPGERPDPERQAYVWLSLRMAIPVGVAAAAALLATADLDRRARAGLAATALPLAVLTLVQFPYAYGIYLCYVAPLAILTWTHVLRGPPLLAPATRERASFVEAHLALALFLAAFAALWVWRCDLRSIGGEFYPARPRARLDLPRGGLDVPAGEAAWHEQVVAEVELHARPGAAIWASPDCPQVYALSGRENPTPTIYDVFDADWKDPPARAARILGVLERRAVDVVVLVERGEFSGPVDPALRAALEARCPRSRAIGPFVVRWR